jgi:cbb3-type cytochrome oxidase cytochrome c subunit
MTQAQQIASHLRQGKSLTAIEALQKFGCFRLAARVLDLRAEGMKIHSQMMKRGTKSFARYYMS